MKMTEKSLRAKIVNAIREHGIPQQQTNDWEAKANIITGNFYIEIESDVWGAEASLKINLKDGVTISQSSTTRNVPMAIAAAATANKAIQLAAVIQALIDCTTIIPEATLPAS